ncbi:MAG: hypothetical protein K8T91_12560 [Planctomycetes bacterium]|nr:hypothetical protein [Planctomycetota bacterium]
MPLAVRCDRCGKSQSVPDSLVGEPIICSYCGNKVIVSADAPLMPPPLPGSAPAAGMSPERPIAPPKPVAPTSAPPSHRPPNVPPPKRGAGALPMYRPSGIPNAGPPIAPPPAAPPPLPPPLTPPQHQAISTTPGLTPYQRLIKQQRTSIWLWTSAGVVTVVILIIGIVALVLHQSNPNPPLEAIPDKLVANPKALAVLGPRQTALGYSLHLLSDFIPAAAPSIEGLPDGTQSFAWQAKPGTESAGSLCRMWVIPKALNIDQELQSLQSMGGLLDYPVTIPTKSTYYRLGTTMLVVRGVLEGKDTTIERKGVIYLIADGSKTIIVAGIAVGPKMKEVQSLLDHAIRTIQRDESPAKPAPSAPAMPAPPAPVTPAPSAPAKATTPKK